MFSVEELRSATTVADLEADLKVVRERLTWEDSESGFQDGQDSVARLSALVNAALVSAVNWESGEGLDLLEQAGEAAELLSRLEKGAFASQARLRGALLYELADLPTMASALFEEGDGPEFLVDFFKRRGPFRSLASGVTNPNSNDAKDRLMRLALCQDVLSLAEFEHDSDLALSDHAKDLEMVARHYEFDLNLTDVKAFLKVVKRRAARSTRQNADPGLLNSLRRIGFPPELWASQTQAIDAGLLDPKFDAWSLAAPTGTGKTFLTRMLILQTLREKPGQKVLYVVPSKALVHQVSSDLHRSLNGIGIEVLSVTAQLTSIDEDEEDEIAVAAVLVLTPEKADLLLRIGAKFLKEVALVVVDEAHHLEEGTRGVLLELYLARLRAALAVDARYVLLSAVAPNIGEITNWLGKSPGSALVNRRATRMRVGTYRIEQVRGANQGVIDYTNGTKAVVIASDVETTQSKGLVQLAERLGSGGPVLVVAKGQKTAENLASELRLRLEAGGAQQLSSEVLETEEMLRLDSRLEREMYAGVELRDLAKWGIAYHHAGMPPRVREAVEDAITHGYIHYVVATTTLAEGVNFPFSTVIVQALATQAPTFEPGVPMSWRIFTPRKFWNIAGRAGRAGFDHQGQVILFEPSLHAEHVDSIDPYLEPNIEKIPPLTSALADGLSSMRQAVQDKELSLDDIAKPVLQKGVPKATQGVVNLMRVGLAHARATDALESSEAYFQGTFAAQVLDGQDLQFAEEVMSQQAQVVSDYLEEPDSPPVEFVAELGLSIDTLSQLQAYVRGLEDWQLESWGKVVIGPAINFHQLKYVVSPILARMAELEGEKLGGIYSSVVEDWCRGRPFSAIKPVRKDRLEELIRAMYSRVQYILPWGLYATNRFVEEEVARRPFPYDGELNKLAYLVDGGVPDWAALHLTSLGFERVDAARLSRVYFDDRLAAETTDVAAWVGAQEDSFLAGVVRGADRRRIDHDFFALVKKLRPRVKDDS